LTGVAGSGQDRIELVGIRAFGRHGVLPEERANGQEFVIDATLWLDLRPAATSDDVSDTVNYADLADSLAKIVSGEPVNLIETLAKRLAQACMEDARVAQAEITVHKPSAPIGLQITDVAVTIRRTRP